LGLFYAAEIFAFCAHFYTKKKFEEQKAPPAAFAVCQ